MLLPPKPVPSTKPKIVRYLMLCKLNLVCGEEARASVSRLRGEEGTHKAIAESLRGEEE